MRRAAVTFWVDDHPVVGVRGPLGGHRHVRKRLELDGHRAASTRRATARRPIGSSRARITRTLTRRTVSSAYWTAPRCPASRLARAPRVLAIDPERVAGSWPRSTRPIPPVRRAARRRRRLRARARAAPAAPVRSPRASHRRVSWRADGGLAWAKCLARRPLARDRAGARTIIRRGAARTASGCSSPHAAWATREALTLFQALDYARPDFIPPLFEPRRLPPGGGTTLLNLIAGLMKDQGVARVRYRGPYPTEQLFTALLECFRYEAGEGLPARALPRRRRVDWHARAVRARSTCRPAWSCSSARDREGRRSTAPLSIGGSGRA